MKGFLLSILLFGTLNSYAQVDGTTDTLLLQFIPKGYSILERQNGDLNLDQYPDCILILKKDNEEEVSSAEHPVNRKFLLLTGKNEIGEYILAEESNLMVYYYSYCPNFLETFTGVAIEPGTFTINHYGGARWRWSRSSTFVYNPKAKKWFLQLDVNDTFDALEEEPEGITTVRIPGDFGKITIKQFDIYKSLE